MAGSAAGSADARPQVQQPSAADASGGSDPSEAAPQGGAAAAIARAIFGGGGAGASTGGGAGTAAGVGALGSAGPAVPWPIDYAPMRALLDGGLVDAGHATSRRAMPEGAEGQSQQNHSVPTLINEDAMHAAAMRLDYALLSEPLHERCAVSAWITRDGATDFLSDHYPLVLDLDCEAW